MIVRELVALLWGMPLDAVVVIDTDDDIDNHTYAEMKRVSKTTNYDGDPLVVLDADWAVTTRPSKTI